MQKIFTLPLKRCAFGVLISLFCCNVAFAQVQKFIEIIPGNSLPDNPEMTAYIARLKSNPNISDYATYSNGNTRGGSGTVTLQNDRSYAIVEIWSSTSRKTFAHEAGHLYGCRHDDTSGSPAYAQAYCIKNGLGIVTDRTMMVGKAISDQQAQNRLLNFSNPNIQVGGKPSGTNNENNAKRVTEKLSNNLPKQKSQGIISQKWSTRDYPSGIYFVRMKVGQVIETKRVLISR